MVEDGLAFIVRECAVSSSQEERPKRIAGWEAKQACTPPSPAPPRRSRSSSKTEDEGATNESVFCMQEPLVRASPDTQAQCNDSYNAAFESDRSRSLSPSRDLDAFRDLWGSRLITQSQTHVENAALDFTGIVKAVTDSTERYAGISDTTKNVALEEGNYGLGVLETGVALGSTRVHKYGLNQDASKAEDKTPSHKALESHKAVQNRFDGNEDVRCIGMDAIAGRLLKYTDISKRPITSQVQGVQQIGIVSGKKINRNDAEKDQQARADDSVQSNLEMPSTMKAIVESQSRFGVNASSFGSENCRNQTAEEGHSAFHKFTQKPRSSSQANSEQVLEKMTSEPKNLHYKEFNCLFKGQLGQTMARGSERKCSIPLQRSMGIVDTSAQTHEKATLKIFSESIIDVVMQVSETLPTSSPSDPDLLSVVMSTGVSLPLPPRDCFGRLIGNKSNQAAGQA